MAISEHDRQVLQDLENNLAGENNGYSSLLVKRRPRGPVVALAGLIIGLAVVFAGLSLTNTTGTFVGVAGSVMIVAGALLGVNNASPWLKSRMRSRRTRPKP
ncbi:MAG: hypothetical protein JWM76_3861 [Pseudonocardiales bacterium]|nr:hypothetical protein [Pseudonocardiales bacterium]